MILLHRLSGLILLLLVAIPIAAEETQVPYHGKWVLSADPSLGQTDYVEIFADGRIRATSAGGRPFDGNYKVIDGEIRALFDVRDSRIGLLFRYDPETDLLTMSAQGTNDQAIYWRGQGKRPETPKASAE